MNRLYTVLGTKYVPGNDVDHVTTRLLPTGVYNVNVSQELGLFFEATSELSLPSKLYGSTEADAKRVLQTFHERPHVTGVLLAGAKGTGKSLLARTICVRSGLPVIIVTVPMTGPGFRDLIAGLEQPAVVLFDEFEKVYDRDEQKDLLSLFDGVYSTKKLFLLTCNSIYDVDEHFHNRPGRIFYLKKFSGLSTEFVREYCELNLKPEYVKLHLRLLEALVGMIEDFSFDMLQALVEEINRYGETPQQAMEFLNVRPSLFGEHRSASWMVEVESDLWKVYNSLKRYKHPVLLASADELAVTLVPQDYNGLRKSFPTIDTQPYVKLQPELLIWSDPNGNSFIFESKDGDESSLQETVRFTFTKEKQNSWNAYSSMWSEGGEDGPAPRAKMTSVKRSSRKAAKAKQLTAAFEVPK